MTWKGGHETSQDARRKKGNCKQKSGDNRVRENYKTEGDQSRATEGGYTDVAEHLLSLPSQKVT